MSKVTFSFYNETLFNGYKANVPGDHSGEYYPAAKVRALVEAAAELVGAGQSHIESTQFYVIYERAAKVRTALAALGGGE